VFADATALHALPTRRSSDLFWIPEKRLDRLNERAMQLLEEVGLRQYASVLAVELPYGRKRALELATTLALEPTVMLLDEPTQGIDRKSTRLNSSHVKISYAV